FQSRVSPRKGSILHSAGGITSANLQNRSTVMICHFFHRSPRLLSRIGAVSLGLLLCAPALVRSQDAVRPSLAGEEASEARRQDIDRLPYNLLLGPVRFRFSATMGVEYNDNINLSDDETATIRGADGNKFTVHADKEEDFIFRPQVNF